jgi:hypothetical protein
MTRKSSLLELSKAYEQVLEEMNIGGEQMPQNVLIKNATSPDQNEIEFIATKPEEIETFRRSPEEMEQTANTIDMNRQSCPECESGECGQHSQEEEEGCEECDYDVHDSGNLDMAKSEVFKIKKYADALMSLVGCGNKIEAWMLSKIVKAADYLCAVKNVIEYESYEKNVSKPMDDFSNDMVLISKITSMLNGEGKEVNEEVLKRIIFNLEILKESK